MIRKALAGLGTRLRQRTGSLLFDHGLHGVARIGRLHPHARPGHQGVEVLRDIPYRDSGDAVHTLDVYRPHPDRKVTSLSAARKALKCRCEPFEQYEGRRTWRTLTRPDLREACHVVRLSQRNRRARTREVE